MGAGRMKWKEDELLPVMFLTKICMGEADSWGSGDADLDELDEETILTDLLDV